MSNLSVQFKVMSKKYQIICKNCGRDHMADRKSVICCSPSCSNKLKATHLIERWLAGESGNKKGSRLKRSIRKYLIEKSEYKCSKCGWNEINPITGTSPLEIDHIDGNSENTKIDNLQVLCPNCHSLTPNWKALNKGNANKERLRYSKL